MDGPASACSAGLDAGAVRHSLRPLEELPAKSESVPSRDCLALVLRGRELRRPDRSVDRLIQCRSTGTLVDFHALDATVLINQDCYNDWSRPHTERPRRRRQMGSEGAQECIAIFCNRSRGVRSGARYAAAAEA